VEILERSREQSVLGGVSQPAIPGLVVKLVASSAPVMTDVLMEMWAAVRGLLWQMPPAALRKY
jgi:urease accessory protein